MGQLHQAIDIVEVINKYKINVVIETGTGVGDTAIRLANNFSDLSIITIECFKEVFDIAINNLKRFKNVQCLQGMSKDILPALILSFNNTTNNILFWLDAHFPGADFGFTRYNSEPDNECRLPLESELYAICTNRDISNDFFVIDDLRIYEDGNFEDGNWVDRHLYGGDGIGFIFNLLGKTHNIKKSYSQQGYIIASPK